MPDGLCRGLLVEQSRHLWRWVRLRLASETILYRLPGHHSYPLGLLPRGRKDAILATQKRALFLRARFFMDFGFLPPGCCLVEVGGGAGVRRERSLFSLAPVALTLLFIGCGRAWLCCSGAQDDVCPVIVAWWREALPRVIALGFVGAAVCFTSCASWRVVFVRALLVE